MSELPQGALIALLEGDGITLPGHGEERQIRCFNPHHNDDTPSMRMNVVKEVYHCHGCDISGNAWTYLTEIRGYSKQNAADMLKQLGWTPETLRQAKEQVAKAQQESSGQATFTRRPYEFVGGEKWGTPRAKAIAQHEYRLADGNLICTRYRYERLHKKNPKVLTFTPASGGGWWVTAPHKDTVPPEDRHAGKLPLYRLPELLRAIEGNDRPIWIVEGEKCVDAVLALQDAPKGGKFPTTCLFGGLHNQPAKSDLAPLKGRKVLLISDTDNKGRNAMLTVARALKKIGCKIQVCLPAGEGGYDVAKAIGEGGYKAMVSWIQHSGIQPYEEVEAQDKRQDTAETLEAIAENVSSLSENEHYVVLGINQQNVVFRVNATRELLAVPVQSLDRAMWLMRLAPLEWWTALCSPKQFSATSRMVIADGLLRIAEGAGLFDPENSVLGRGAFRHEDRFYFNTGQTVLAEDAQGRLTHKIQFESIPKVLRPGPEIVFERHEKGAQWAEEFFNTMMRFRWRSPNDGWIYLGWLVSSLVGGALTHRPGAWILAKADSGKTFLANPVMSRIMGNAFYPFSNATESGIAEIVLDHSLPVWIDEFEPTSGLEQRFLQILALVRQSTSGGGRRGRGGATKSLNAVPRFSVMVSSINQLAMTEADSSRFAMISFNPEGLESDAWESLEKDIMATITPRKCSAIRAHIIENTPAIVKDVERWRQVYGKNPDLTQRSILVFSALAAGATFLAGIDIEIQPTVRLMHDEFRPLEVLLTTPLHTSITVRHSTTLLNALAEIIENNPHEYEQVRQLKEFCAQNGVMWDRDLQMVIFAHTSEALRRVLRHTEFHSLGLAQYLMNLRFTHRITKRLHIGNRRVRCIGLPLADLQSIGYLTKETRGEQVPEDDNQILEFPGT